MPGTGIDTTKAAVFDSWMFAGTLSERTYACFVRRYDASYLAQHLKQKVSAMKLLVTAENPPEEKITNYSFRIGTSNGFKLQRRVGDAIQRRSILWAAASAISAAFVAPRVGAATEAPPTRKLSVVYHLNDLEKVSFVVGNIQNHLDRVRGPGNVTIALVVHGQALRTFHASAANPDLTKHIGQFSRAGLELAACGNSMMSQKVGLGDLLPGFTAANQRGVVRIAELQSQGYLYLRP